MRVLYVSGENTNPAYNPDTCHNGGGYFQPSGTAILLSARGERIEVDYEDISCGDFGERYMLSATCMGIKFSICINEMDDAMGDNPEMVERVSQAFYVFTGESLYEVYLMASAAISQAARDAMDAIDDDGYPSRKDERSTHE